jgi:hypothetical protein
MRVLAPRVKKICIVYRRLYLTQQRQRHTHAEAQGHSQCEQRDLQHVTLPWVGITHGELCGER